MIGSHQRYADREPGGNPGRSRRCEGSCASAGNHWPRGREGGGGGSPESEDLPRRRKSRTPRGRRIRVSTTHHPGRRGAARLCAGRSGARRAREGARRGQDDDHLRLDAADAYHRPERARRARRREHRRRVLLPRALDSVRPVRRPDRALPGRGRERLELQDQRRLASRRRGPGNAERWRQRALVLVDLQRDGRLADAAPAKAAGTQLLHGALAERPGHVDRSDGRAASRRRSQCEDARRPCLRREAPRACPRNAAERGALERDQVKRVVLVALALVLLPGCGRERAGSGRATLWVTRDRGATVLAARTVPAGLTAMQALDRDLDVKTRYSGRFVQSIEGVAGDASKQRDWFWFLNGIEADRSAADYRLHAGDVEWWDFRSW